MSGDAAGVIRWEEPPPGRHPAPDRIQRTSTYEPAAIALTMRPGEWGLIYEGEHGPASGLATHIRTGATRCFTPAGDFEAVSRALGHGRHGVWARYVGSAE